MIIMKKGFCVLPASAAARRRIKRIHSKWEGKLPTSPPGTSRKEGQPGTSGCFGVVDLLTMFVEENETPLVVLGEVILVQIEQLKCTRGCLIVVHPFLGSVAPT